ncbi:16S rRNA (guanine1207-N2)-methyltransferase [Lipingzhangella halophila]|uniref:16S rRNA (Guanine1207-N2)-methyltransferase n=1 Tax=Lipingzhangella halophila TaxID=1783352 RepID=A0A7W7RHE8_9ACTN|nr:methyltransferase [Lipingzhangella halophila]MBB4931984.1 16S rRNA (guanine1207-N2)-methyltransferase [Lipingzhangella halophila]
MAQHYFESNPNSTSRPGTVELILPDLHLRLATDSGVFSPAKIDLGTRILLETVPPPPTTGTLLDLGCGYGPIALTMAARAPHATVVAIDTNSRAVELTRTNARTHHLDNDGTRLRCAHTDPTGTPTGHPDPHTRTALDGPFDAIWTNPPIRVGKTALHTMLRTWLNRLSPTGTAHLVVQRNLGADTLHRWLNDNGYPTERAASRAGYRILRTHHPT